MSSTGCWTPAGVHAGNSFSMTAFISAVRAICCGSKYSKRIATGYSRRTSVNFTGTFYPFGGRMNREYHKWFSPRLHRDMELLVFGHAGARVLVFPTRQGRFFDYENWGLVGALHHQISNG